MSKCTSNVVVQASSRVHCPWIAKRCFSRGNQIRPMLQRGVGLEEYFRASRAI
jgi:hypothetical protein